jgi:hypothetical protein
LLGACLLIGPDAQRQRTAGERNDRIGHRAAVAAAIGIKKAEFDQGSDGIGANHEIDRDSALPFQQPPAAGPGGAG